MLDRRWWWQWGVDADGARRKRSRGVRQIWLGLVDPGDVGNPGRDRWSVEALGDGDTDACPGPPALANSSFSHSALLAI